jgi:peptidoglycan hydrolase CwlO-like protein
MEKIFGILTGVVLLLSVWIGFKNSSKLSDQKETLQDAENLVASNEAEKKDVTGKIKSVQAEIETLAKQSEDSQGELVTMEEETSALKATLTEKETMLATVEEKLSSVQELRDQISDSQDLIEQVESTKNKIAQLKSDIDSEKTGLEDAQQSAEQAEALLASKKVIVESRSSGKSAPTLSTSVRGVYGTWGFVTLNSGNAQGVVPGSILDVLRNGEVVAKLKVTTVEQNRSAADIIADSEGVTVALRSGDRVVAEQVAQ